MHGTMCEMVARTFAADLMRHERPGSVVRIVTPALPENARNTELSTVASVGFGSGKSFFPQTLRRHAGLNMQETWQNRGQPSILDQAQAPEP